MKKVTFFAAAALALCTAFVSCGGSNTQNNNNTETTATAEDGEDGDYFYALREATIEQAQTQGAQVEVVDEGEEIVFNYTIPYTDQVAAALADKDAIIQLSKTTMATALATMADQVKMYGLMAQAIEDGKTLRFVNDYSGQDNIEFTVGAEDLEAASAAE